MELWIMLRMVLPTLDTSSSAPRSWGLVGPVDGLGVNRMFPYGVPKGPGGTGTRFIRGSMRLIGMRSQQRKRCVLVNPISNQFRH